MAEKQEPPLWLDAVRKFERAIGDPIESIVTSEAYFDAMTRFKRAQSQVTGAVENVTNDVYRMFNIPAGSDVRKLREQLSRMERRLEAMSKELAKRDERVRVRQVRSRPPGQSPGPSRPPRPSHRPRSSQAATPIRADETKPADEINPSDGPKQAK